MKAVVFHERGGVHKLRYEERPDPSMKDNEALVSVKACALNHLDRAAAEDYPGFRFPFLISREATSLEKS